MAPPDVLHLQRAAGNRAVGRTLTRSSPSAAPRGSGTDSRRQAPGLPSPLRHALEGLSGLDLSGVRVHRSSPLPASLNAWAHARGADIYLGPGQERRLPHEAWHVVQQMRGRVRPTTEVAGVPVADTPGLEREADRMGAVALRSARAAEPRTGEASSEADAAARWAPHPRPPRVSPSFAEGAPVQRAMKFEIQTSNYVWMTRGRGDFQPVPRKYGRLGASEKGEESFLTTGTKGKPTVRKGDFVEAKGVDPARLAQYVWTYTVVDLAKGQVRGPRRRRRKGRVNRGTYELRYVDAEGRRLNVHRDARGRFEQGSGPLMRKARRFEEGTAIELQAESGGFIEFETPKWIRRWSKLRKRIQEAVDMTKTMDTAPLVTDQGTKDAVKARVAALKASPQDKRTANLGTLREWPSSFDVRHLPIVRRGGRLLVEIVNTAWRARIQASESFALPQYESYLKEHEWAVVRDPTLARAKEILDTLKPADPARAAAFEREHANLKALLQMIVNYLLRGQKFSGKPKPSKFAFILMARTSFYSMYHELLTPEERTAFQKLVRDGTIPSKLGLSNSDPVLEKGHGAVAAGDRNNPKIGPWLRSIIQGGGWRREGPRRDRRKTDLLSPMKHGSAAMGRFPVEKRPGKKHTGLVKMELRNTVRHGGPTMGRDKWVEWAGKIFKDAATRRPRPDVPDDPSTRTDETRKTGLVWDP
jgi:hypothetical protein